MNPPLADREFLRILEQVTLVCRDNIAGVLGMDHRSRLKGPGLEFSDYRHYSSGDDPRFLDWSAYLRIGKLLLKVFNTEQHIPVRILIDCSQSMDCEGSVESKFDYARRLAATFAYLALLHLDTAAIAPFAETMAKPFVIAGGRDRFLPLLRFLEALTCEGKTDLYRTAKQFLASFHSPGLVALISDFFDEEGAERTVKMLRTAGHDVILLQVHSGEEQRPTVYGELILEDAENSQEQRVESSPETAALYEREFLAFCSRLQSLAVRNGGRYARAVTSVPYQEFVLRGLRDGRVLA